MENQKTMTLLKDLKLTDRFLFDETMENPEAHQALIDSGLLPSGSTSYNLLNDSYIIIITPFDLFGCGKYQYTFHAKCEEVPELKLGDGATRIFLNTKGKNPEEVSRELIDFLKYVENTDDKTAEESGSELIKTIHECVKQVKSSEEIGVKYMQAWEEKIYEREEGREEGEVLRLIRQVCKKIPKNQSCKEIADALEEEPEYIQKIMDVAKTYAPEYDTEQILDELIETDETED